jgi:hypothetical protein
MFSFMPSVGSRSNVWSFSSVTTIEAINEARQPWGQILDYVHAPIREQFRGQHIDKLHGERCKLWRSYHVTSIGSRSFKTFQSFQPFKASRQFKVQRFKPSGSSKFNVQEFQVILRLIPTVSAVSNVPLLRSVPNRSRPYRFSVSRRAARCAPDGTSPAAQEGQVAEG